MAKDVCDVLGIETRDISDRLESDEITYVDRTHLVLNPGKAIICVSEPGLYSLILRSRKPEAKVCKMHR